MSILVMSRVWQNSRQEGGSLLVLLALADFANDSGAAYPKISVLAHKARLSEASIHRILRDLCAAGELSVAPNAGPRRTNLYTVLIGPQGIAHDRVSPTTGYQNDTLPDTNQGGCQNDRVSPVSVEGVIGEVQRVLLVSVEGVIGDKSIMKEPSKNRQAEPSLEPSGRREEVCETAVSQTSSSGPNGQKWLKILAEDSRWPRDNLSLDGFAHDIGERFPDLDLVMEAYKAYEWLQTPKGLKKTSRGMKRFWIGWVQRAATQTPVAENRHGKPGTQDADRYTQQVGRWSSPAPPEEAPS